MMQEMEYITVKCPTCGYENELVKKGNQYRHYHRFPAYPRCIFEASLLNVRKYEFVDEDDIWCENCRDYIFYPAFAPIEDNEELSGCAENKQSTATSEEVKKVTLIK